MLFYSRFLSILATCDEYSESKKRDIEVMRNSAQARSEGVAKGVTGSDRRPNKNAPNQLFVSRMAGPYLLLGDVDVLAEFCCLLCKQAYYPPQVGELR